MKYKIGQRLFSKNYCYDEDDDSDYGVVCVGIFSDGTWKYGVKYDRAEYDCMIDFYTENEMEEEFTTEKKDHEEPLYYYFIQDDGRIGCDAVDPYNHKSKVEERKSIGNYFNTREEAEKAVERLRAWTRLKDKGVEFRWIDMQTGRFLKW